MKVLTSRVVVFALVSILTSFVARAEEKKVVGGDKVGDAAEVSKSDLTQVDAHKIVASKSYVDYEISALAAHTINGAPLSNAANVFFGVGEGAASSGTKTAQVPSIPVATFGTVPTGVIITVQPEYTAEAGFVLSLNGGRRANVLYNGVVLTNADAPKIWNSKYPSTFVFNGASWVFMGSGAVDENTEYDVMGVDEGTTGAATDERTLTAANLKPIIQGTTLTNIDTTATTAVTASDTITTGIGKLQGQINALGANTLTWGASEATSANAYDTTFVGDDGATANAWPTADKTKLIDTAALANALALKQNKITTGGVTETLYSRTVTLPALASYNYSTNDGLVANTVGLLTNTINNLNPIDWDQAAEEDPYSQTDLDNVVPTIKLIAKGFRRLYWWPEGQGIPYTATQLTNAINTYSTTFDPTPTHVDGNWPSQMALGNTPEDTIVSAKVFAQGLALKQNKIAAGTAGNVVTYSGTAGQFGTPLSIMDGLSSYGEIAVLENAYNFGDPETSQTTVWPLAEATQLINGRAFADGLSLKQTVLPVTSNGMGNGPNYVYNATTNPTADGSVVTTTATAGTVGQRGIATAPTYDANDNLTNGSWLPTMSAVESMVSGSDVSSHLVNGQPLSNNQITLYGKETEDSVGPRKKVSLYDYSNPSNPTPIQIDSLVPGMVVVIKPTVAATATFTLSVNGVSGGKAVKYHGISIPEGMAGKIWDPNSPSVFMYDGTNWNYIAGGEDNGVESLEWASSVHPAAITGYSTAFTGMAQGAWNARDVYSFVKGPTFANALALKQNKISSTSDGTNNTPNYVYNATTNPTAAGSVVTTTATAGTVGQRGIATAPVSDGNGGYSNGDWLPTVNAMMNAINTATNTLSWTATETTAAGNYSTTFDGTTGNWPAADADKLIDGTGLATALSNKQNKIVAGTAGNVVTYSGTAGTVGSATVSSAATYTNDALTNGNDIANITAVETKQDKIDADMVGVTMNGGDVDLPALLTYGTPDGNNGNDGLLGNKIGLLTYADYHNLGGGWFDSRAPITDWSSDMDIVVPTMRLLANELQKLYWPTVNNAASIYGYDANTLTTAITGYSTLFNGESGQWPNLHGLEGPLVTTRAFGEGLALKQNKIVATSDGTNNTPNYVYNATTNSTADGSVLTTTTTAGTVGQRGIATAPTYDANDNLTNGSWLPTMSAVESMVSGSDVSSHLVNGQPLSNNQITLYGTSDSTGTQKLVTLYDYSNPNSPTPIEMDALVPGTVIVIKPTVDQPAEGAFAAIKITNVPNNGGRKMAKYHGGNIISVVAQKIWKADSPSVWVYDGTNFNYVSGGLDLTLDWDGDRHPGIINAYNTDFDSGTGHWWANEQERVVPSTTFAQGLALKQNVLPAQASGAPVTIPTYPAYGTSDGVIGKMYLDTSSLYTANDEHFPSSKLINTTLSSYVPKSDALNTNDTNSNLAAVSGAPSWATTNGVASLYRVPGVASGSNWAATTMANWADSKYVPTMDTLANSLAGLYDAVGVSVEDRILNYDETGYSIGGANIPVPSQIEYTGDRYLDDGTQLFWLPQLDKNGVLEATQVLQHYAEDKTVPSMDELAYALDGVLQTNETTKEWLGVAEDFYGIRDVKSLFNLANMINNNDLYAVRLYKSGYLQTFAPTLEALMNESAALIQIINLKQDKLSGTSGNLVTYGATDGTTGSKEIATTITNNANTVPNTQAVYNAVNRRQIKIPQTGQVRDASGIMSAISDWTSASVKGTALVTKTSSDGVVGERKIFEAGDTYTDNTTTNIQIATIGAVMENTFTKTCAEYRPGTTGETAANCWLWEITSNTVTPACSANGSTCSSNSDCCSNYCTTTRPGVCADRPEIICGHEGASCSLNTCCDGLTCNSQTNTCTRDIIKS